MLVRATKVVDATYEVECCSGEDFVAVALSIDELISAGDDKLFRQMSNESHCLHSLLTTQRNNEILTCNSIRNRGHNYLLSQTESTLIQNSFINRCLFSYI